MATQLKALVLNSKIKARENDLAKLMQKRDDLEARAQELASALEELNEESSDEERAAFDESVNEVDTQQNENEAEISAAEADIENLRNQLEEINKKTRDIFEHKNEKRTEDSNHMTRHKFFNLDAQERTEFFNNQSVKEFLQRVREVGKAAAAQNRSVSGGELVIPTEILELMRENILDYSKLVRRVRLMPVNGKARQAVMGEIPEAVWTEACAALNDININFSAAEVDAYKVGGYIAVCRALLDDSDINLAEQIIEALLVSIGIALDKAILFGHGKKMPLGIAVRLAQTSMPTDYSPKARPWVDLHESNIITIDSSKAGIEFFKAFLTASAAAKSNYSRGVKFWAMNEATYTQIKVQALTLSAEGRVVSYVEGVMPVIGGDIIVLSDQIIPDNTIIGGYGDLYLLAERSGAVVERSDECRFIEDQAVFKGTARYDGLPVIAEGFVAIGLGAAPQTSATFALDTANDASLADLVIGSESLSPAFSCDKFNYTVTAAAASGAISAVPNQAGATVEMTYNGKKITNGQSIKFADGTQNLVITISKGLAKLTYTVAISHTAG